MDLLRFATIGSVDDGKSTLHRSPALRHPPALRRPARAPSTAASERRGLGEVDLSFVTDGLRADANRASPSTWRTATPPPRTASSSSLTARGTSSTRATWRRAPPRPTWPWPSSMPRRACGEQSRRHICIAALLGVDQLVVCANKMDLLEWDKSAYQGIVDEMETLSHRFGHPLVHGDPHHRPQRRQRGGSVPTPPPGYDGPDGAGRASPSWPEGRRAGFSPSTGCGRGGNGGRLPVQWVLRQPGGGRSYAGMVNGGPLPRRRRRSSCCPEGSATTVSSARDGRRPARSGREVGLSVSVHLADHLDVSRGDLIAAADEPPEVTERASRPPCAGSRTGPLSAGDRLRHQAHHPGHPGRGRQRCRARSTSTSSSSSRGDRAARQRDRRGRRCATATPLAVDPYVSDRITGSFVLIDELSFAYHRVGIRATPAP